MTLYFSLECLIIKIYLTRKKKLSEIEAHKGRADPKLGKKSCAANFVGQIFCTTRWFWVDAGLKASFSNAVGVYIHTHTKPRKTSYLLRKFDCFFLTHTRECERAKKKMRKKSATFLHYRLLQKRTHMLEEKLTKKRRKTRLEKPSNPLTTKQAWVKDAKSKRRKWKKAMQWLRTTYELFMITNYKT